MKLILKPRPGLACWSRLHKSLFFVDFIYYRKMYIPFVVRCVYNLPIPIPNSCYNGILGVESGLGVAHT